MTAPPNVAPTDVAELLDVKMVSEWLSCSGRHVYRLSDGGKMPPPIKLGTLTRWRRSELVDWLVAGCPPVHKRDEPCR